MTKKQTSILFFGYLLVVLMGCKQAKKSQPVQKQESTSSITHATGFTVKKEADLTIIEVTAAWPGADNFKYALVPKENYHRLLSRKMNMMPLWVLQ